MADPNMDDFYRRVKRLQAQRAKGQGFEASGTLGRSFYAREVARRRSPLGLVLLILGAMILLKAAMIAVAGQEQYALRVDRMMAGQGLEHVGGWLMQIDPVSGWVADKVAPYLAQR